jgi:hypothetical protein
MTENADTGEWDFRRSTGNKLAQKVGCRSDSNPKTRSPIGGIAGEDVAASSHNIRLRHQQFLDGSQKVMYCFSEIGDERRLRRFGGGWRDVIVIQARGGQARGGNARLTSRGGAIGEFNGAAIEIAEQRLACGAMACRRTGSGGFLIL